MNTTTTATPMALWGGIECTVNRVGDRYQDQLLRNGHHDRPDDLNVLADLGLRTLRYPLVWERTAPSHPHQPDWRWADERFARLQSLAINPIVGLVHHGCGPKYATFDTDDFVNYLPQYARQVAERYPWVTAYTPVNEPLTTARFSGLYGLWYPHTQSDRVFSEILLRECRATVEAMRQIRLVQPDAQLVQTEDLGYTHASPRLQYQADWENNRRWLTWDLLCGRVVPGHPFWDYFRYYGIAENELWFFVENACPPSVIGVNHYITSERYLDENVTDYPPHLHSGNGRDRYADTEVVRAAPEQRLGLADLLLQAHDRYHLPIAVTEAHLGCTVDEQIRWLWDMWQEAGRAKNAGADVQAVTVWALLGSYDWHCLLTRQEGRYEAGAFNVSTGELCATELTGLVQCLATGQDARALIPEGPGWWQLIPEFAV